MVERHAGHQATGQGDDRRRVAAHHRALYGIGVAELDGHLLAVHVRLGVRGIGVDRGDRRRVQSQRRPGRLGCIQPTPTYVLSHTSAACKR